MKRKKNMVGDEEKALQNCRPSLKSLASFNNYPKWKNKVLTIWWFMAKVWFISCLCLEFFVWVTQIQLRENCFKRVREDRTRLLWKLRLPEAKLSNNEVYLISISFFFFFFLVQYFLRTVDWFIVCVIGYKRNEVLFYFHSQSVENWHNND